MTRPKCAQTPPTFPSLVQAFFAVHLTQHRALSPRTVATYRDAFVLFLNFASKRCAKSPAALEMKDITPGLILAFLDHLEKDRGNAVRSRNARLAALRAFLKFAAHRDVSSLHIIEQALGVPVKRFERPMLGFLSREEMLAVIGLPGKTWISQRDHLLFGLMYNTGARVSEIIGVRMEDVVLDRAACVHLMGKGRKRRSLPLWNTTVKEVRAWRKLNPQLGANSALLPNRNSLAMTRDNVAKRLDIAVQTAAMSIPELTNRQISPHCIRHTTAMHMLQSGSSIEEIALWLGHESPATTHQYVEASLAMKEKALARLQEPDSKIGRYHATDELLEFLRTL